MPILPFLKQYLITKTQMKFNLNHSFATNFINAIEQEHSLTGYEEALEESKSYTELFNRYFDSRCVIKEA